MTAPKITLTALALSLSLTACDGGDGGNKAQPSATRSGIASPTASPTPTFPISTFYRVTPKPGVTDDDLKDAVDDIGKLQGVTAVTFDPKKHDLTVELSAINISANAPRVYEELEELGTVTIS